MPENKPLVTPLNALIDLILFLSLMFFVRTLYFSSIGYWGNILLNTVATLSLATLLLHLRGQSWKTMGLTKPKSYLKVLGIAAVAFIATLGSIMFFEIFLRDILFPVVSSQAVIPTEIPEPSADRFPNMKGRIALFLGVIVIVWIESCLEELQDRGFSLNRFEALLSKIPFSIVFAVIIQAAIFGFRHLPSHGLAGAMVVGIIGLVFGIVYVVSGRNLWPLIIAHCFLNTISMMDKF